MKLFFVTGTDTDAGKTYAACALLAAAGLKGLRTAALKPVASGCVVTAEGLRNDDAVRLLAQTNSGQSYDEVNPIALQPAIAPHIAARSAGVFLQLSRLRPSLCALAARRADFALVEGAGGWYTPLNETETLADLAAEAQLPVILVIGLRLGCINHALLSAEAIAGRGLKLAGWIGSCISADMPYRDENIGYLLTKLDAPLLGILPHQPEATPAEAARHLDLTALNL